MGELVLTSMKHTSRLQSRNCVPFLSFTIAPSLGASLLSTFAILSSSPLLPYRFSSY